MNRLWTGAATADSTIGGEAQRSEHRFGVPKLRCGTH
tara:strand:+ start:501 stop:611 length:111 start_codon:yes stop_codon:yes gene_type:complete